MLVHLALLVVSLLSAPPVSPAVPAPAPAPLAPAVGARGPVPVAPVAPVVPAAAGEPSARLVRAALHLAGRERPLVAQDVLLEGLAERLSRDGVHGDFELAELETAAALLTTLVERTGDWSGVVERLDALAPDGLDATPAIGARLQHLRARARRAVGDVEAARGIVDALGVVRDWLLIGPFDNERGSGFAIAHPPELAFDEDAPVPGKERDVFWRALEASDPLGRVWLDPALRPNSQAVAYLATAVHADGDRDVVLRLGSTCAFKVFLRGQELAARKLERPRGLDQDAVVLPLRAGWNPLLVKLAVEEQAWSFEARLTDPGGMPLAAPVDSTRLGEVDASLALRGAEATPAEDVPARLARLREAGLGGDVALLEALWHLTVHPDDVVAESDRRAAEAALALAPDDPLVRYVHATALGAAGRSDEEVEVNARLAALEATLELDPEHVAALLDLAEFAERQSPRPDRVRALLDRAQAVTPDSRRVLLARARHLRERDREVEAALLEERADLTPEGRVDGGARADHAQRLRARGDVAGADAWLRAGLEARRLPGPSADAWIDRLFEQGRPDEAAALGDRILASVPWYANLRARLARRFELLGDLDRAARYWERAAELCPDDTQPLHGLVRVAERRDQLLAAAELLDEIVRLDPGDDDARRHRALLDDSERDDFEAPYRWDALALAGSPMPQGGSDPVELLRRTTVYKLNPDGTEHTYEHLVFRALNPGGVKALDTYWIDAPAGAQLQVHNVRVIHPDGSFERAPPPRRRGGGGRWFDLPPLGVGDLVQIESRVDETRADVFGEYFGTRHTFYAPSVDGLAPTRRSELVVITPPDVPLHAAERNADGLQKQRTVDEQGRLVLRWEARDLPRPKLESNMPELVEFSPLVDVTTFESWQAFATWWWAFIEKEFVTTDAMRAKVAELTAGLTTEREKVAAINRFVSQEIRYNSWPFGTHGYEPFSAATIFERRFGDCKDKSILLRQLLAEVGVEAVPVLIRARWNRPDEPLDAAMVEHFNHCIAYLPATDAREGYYLDATADRNPVGYLRADDQGARVLHVTPEGGSLHDIPYAPPADNALVRRYDVQLDLDGGGVVSLRDESNGQSGVVLRYRYGGEQGGIEQVLADEFGEAFGSVDVLDVQTSDLEDITTPARLEARLAADELWTQEDVSRVLPVSFDDLGLTGVASEAAEQRVHPVVLDRPYAQDTEITWRLPPGARLQSLPPPVSIELGGLLRYEQRAEEVEGGVRVRRRFELRERRIGLDDYAAFRDALRQVQLAEDRSIRIDVSEAQ